jgi:hypothetical protein
MVQGIEADVFLNNNVVHLLAVKKGYLLDHETVLLGSVSTSKVCGWQAAIACSRAKREERVERCASPFPLNAPGHADPGGRPIPGNTP